MDSIHQSTNYQPTSETASRDGRSDSLINGDTDYTDDSPSYSPMISETDMDQYEDNINFQTDVQPEWTWYTGYKSTILHLLRNWHTNWPIFIADLAQKKSQSKQACSITLSGVHNNPITAWGPHPTNSNAVWNAHEKVYLTHMIDAVKPETSLTTINITQLAKIHQNALH
jgi:hypothetical protein